VRPLFARYERRPNGPLFFRLSLHSSFQLFFRSFRLRIRAGFFGFERNSTLRLDSLLPFPSYLPPFFGCVFLPLGRTFSRIDAPGDAGRSHGRTPSELYAGFIFSGAFSSPLFSPALFFLLPKVCLPFELPPTSSHTLPWKGLVDSQYRHSLNMRLQTTF